MRENAAVPASTCRTGTKWQVLREFVRPVAYPGSRSRHEQELRMRYRPLGRSGLLISQVVLGTARFGQLADDASDPIVGRAIELGISTFDTADAYNRGESEVQLGRALGRRRQQVVICSKVGLRVGDDDAAH